MKFSILNFKHSNKTEGQALITLLFFTFIGITVVAASVAILFANTQSTTTNEQGQMAYYLAESGIEDGTLKLLRNPLYTGTYVYNSIPGSTGQVTVVIGNGSIKSTGVMNSTARIVSVTTTYSNGILTISNWSEQPL